MFVASLVLRIASFFVLDHRKEAACSSVVCPVGAELLFELSICEKEFHGIEDLVRQWVGVAIDASADQGDPHEVSVNVSSLRTAKAPANLLSQSLEKFVGQFPANR